MRIMEIVINTHMHNPRERKKLMNIKSVSSLSAAITAAGALLFTINAHATIVDLTTSANASGQIGDALFFATDQQPAGTGFIDPFLRVQASPTEQGYNTDGGFPFNDKNPDNFQHSIQLSSLAQFNISGTEYFKFMLDANQSGASNHTFTLTQLQFYTSNNPAQMTTAFNADGTLSLGKLAYNMNLGGGSANSVITTATGSGKYDAIVYVPVSDFTQSDKYMYLYFAGQGNGGFEEWTAATAVAPVPEVTPGSVIFGFLGLVVAATSRRALMGRVRLMAAQRKTRMG
jgi:hypothetical protein